MAMPIAASEVGAAEDAATGGGPGGRKGCSSGRCWPSCGGGSFLPTAANPPPPAITPPGRSDDSAIGEDVATEIPSPRLCLAGVTGAGQGP